VADPYPILTIHSTSGLTFPWAFYTGPTGSAGDANFGHGGCAAAELMLIRFEDFGVALQQLIGYSWRDASTTPPRLRRVLPFKHPFYTNLWCTRVVKVEGLKPDGLFVDTYGPFETYKILRLTLQFSRPSYAVLPDNAILDMSGNPQEWLRYTDRLWQPEIEVYSREGTQFRFTEGTGPTATTPAAQYPGSIGLPIPKARLARRWYQLPEFGVYNVDGFPNNVLKDYLTGAILCETLNDATFFGIPAGCLRYVAPEIIPQPLPLPPGLMQLAGNEYFQLQYDVVFHFVWFDPPLGPGATTRGHNTVPWADTFWYKATSVQSGNPQFASSTLSNLWQIN
jgi:hypothetical protein